MIDHEAGRFNAARGDRLYCRRWIPAAPIGHAVIVHGIGEHCGRYEDVAEPLNGRRWAVHGFDHRGHGRSPGPRGHVNRWVDYLDDVTAMLHTLPDDGLPRFLLGHSMGGLIVLGFALDRPEGLSGVVASAPPLDPKAVATPFKAAMARLLSPILPRLPLPVHIGPEVLSRDPEIVKSAAEDPLNHRWVTPRWGAEMLGAIDHVNAAAADFPLSLLLIHGDADAVSAVEGSHRFFDRVENDDKTLRIFEGTYHEPHHDLEADRVIAQIGDWLGERA